MTLKHCRTILFLIGIAFLFVTADAFAFNLAEPEFGQCFKPQSFSWLSEPSASKDKTDFLHSIIQKLIDLWLFIARYTIEFVCGIVRSLGFQCS